MILSRRRMNALYGASDPSPITISDDADESADVQARGESRTEREGMNTTAQDPCSRITRAPSLGSVIRKNRPIGTKREDVSTAILIFSSFLSFDRKNILLGKPGVAFLADLHLVSIDLLLIETLDGSPLADRACSSAVVELIADTCSSMCLGHFPLLIIFTGLLYPKTGGVVNRMRNDPPQSSSVFPPSLS